MTDTYNEQLVLYNWERTFAQLFVPVAAALGATRLHAPERWGSEAGLPHAWEIGRKSSGSSSSRKKHAYKTVIFFDGIAYTDGDPDVGETIIYPLNDGKTWSRTYRPRAAGIKETITDAIQLSEESWSQYNVNASFSVSDNTEIKAGVKAGPAEASVTKTISYNANTGFAKDDGQRQKAIRDFRVATEVVAEVGDDIVLACDIAREKHVTPIGENGYIEATMRIDLSDWADEAQKWLAGSKAAKERNVIRCNSIQDLIDFLEGQRVAEYPNMRGFLDEMYRHDHWSAKGTQQFHRWITNRENRRQQLRKERVRIVESAGDIRTNFVAG